MGISGVGAISTNMMISGNATGMNASGISVGMGGPGPLGPGNSHDFKMKHNSSN